MILSVTDGIEVAEHTEPQERCEFIAEYREAQDHAAGDAILSNVLRCALLRRQAE